MAGPSVRNDALWAAMLEVRNRNLVKAEAWRDAAVADGWSIEPTYDYEPVERAWRLSREGFSVQGITRAARDDTEMTTADIHIWGPDGLAIRPPPIYDWSAIVAGSRTCNACGATDVETQRYGFAGRCCAACRPEMARIHEQPGWTN